MEGLLSFGPELMNVKYHGRTRSNFEISVLGSETAAAGPEQSAAAS